MSSGLLPKSFMRRRKWTIEIERHTSSDVPNKPMEPWILVENRRGATPTVTLTTAVQGQFLHACPQRLLTRLR